MQIFCCTTFSMRWKSSITISTYELQVSRITYCFQKFRHFSIQDFLVSVKTASQFASERKTSDPGGCFVPVSLVKPQSGEKVAGLNPCSCKDRANVSYGLFCPCSSKKLDFRRQRSLTRLPTATSVVSMA